MVQHLEGLSSKLSRKHDAHYRDSFKVGTLFNVIHLMELEAANKG